MHCYINIIFHPIQTSSFCQSELPPHKLLPRNVAIADNVPKEGKFVMSKALVEQNSLYIGGKFFQFVEIFISVY